MFHTIKVTRNKSLNILANAIYTKSSQRGYIMNDSHFETHNTIFEVLQETNTRWRYMNTLNVRNQHSLANSDTLVSGAGTRNHLLR
jgi:hypothetical protein